MRARAYHGAFAFPPKLAPPGKAGFFVAGTAALEQPLSGGLLIGYQGKRGQARETTGKIYIFVLCVTYQSPNRGYPQTIEIRREWSQS